MSGKSEDAPEIPQLIGKVECPIPPEGLVYDYLYEFKGRGKWTPWLELIKDKTVDPNIKRLSDIIVPTMDTVRYSYLMDVMITHGRAVMFVGPTGTGKTVYVKNKLLNDLNKEEYQPLVINFSAQTRAGQTQVRVCGWEGGCVCSN